MIPVIDQDNASNILTGAKSIIESAKNLKDSTVEGIETIAKLSKMIIDSIDWIKTILFNPVVILTFIDKMSIVVILSLIILKMLGFNNLEKWILLSILIKIVAIILL